LGEDLVQLSDRGVWVAGVIHDISGLLAFDVERPLAGLAAEQFFAAPAAMFLHAFQSLLERGFDENHTIAHLVPTRFEQQSGVEHNGFGRRIGSCRGDLFA